MFLQKTASDTIALWTSNNDAFPLPITISTGTGIENFFNIDQPPINIITRQTLNRNIYAMVRPIVMTGSVTFHPQSTALVALRSLLMYQQTSGVPVYGTLLIINSGAITVDKYQDFLWTSPYPAANRNRVMSDISLSFSCQPPTEVSLGSIASIGTTLAGVLG